MDSKTPKVESKTPENQCCAVTVEEMCAATLGHYDDISTKACHWHNQVPQAIKFWYLEKPKLELALAAAEHDITRLMDTCTTEINRAEAAEARAREAEKDTERLDWVEMLTIPSDEINDLVRNWKVDGKRYATGIRAAIDAALARGEQGGEK